LRTDRADPTPDLEKTSKRAVASPSFAQSQTLLHIRGARRRFATPEGGEVVALDSIDLDVHANEFLTLLGPSGCGKTTLLRAIAGFEALDAGSIALDGQPLADVPPYRRPFNTVFQSYALFPHLCVADNVGYGLDVAGVPRQERNDRVGEALALVGLAGLERRRPRQLSGGQQQRVALARALVNRPRLLLLDEPLSALDRHLRQAMQMELKSLQHRVGITFLVVTHDQEEALVMSDRIAVMQGGRVQQVGAPGEIYDRPVNRFVAGFIGNSNLLSARVTERSGDRVTLASDGGLVLHACHHDLTPGDRVDVLLRPEQLRIDDGTAPSGVALEGTLETSVFVGADRHLRIATAGGDRLTALARHVAGERESRLVVGERVRVTYLPEGVHVMRSAAP